ncbi:MAG: DNA-formamidopyrimidine glycosylase [Alkalibacterium sp.]|nr:DNA-formamidopyrimidine glycosylase [Alkalibacterium sp.]
MPELPEVENVKNGLTKLIIGKKIMAVDILWNNIIKDPSVEVFRRELEGETFREIKRRGKFLLFVLDNYTLISHLRMEGKFRLESSGQNRTKHTHVIFKLDNNEELRYLDVRKFGRMSLVAHSDLQMHPSLTHLGPEPVENNLLKSHLEHKFKKTSRPIKAVLLDQSIVAGIGNIYADEILFLSGIYPGKLAVELSEEDIVILHQSILQIMAEAVNSGGTTIRTYSNAYGLEGSYQNKLKVYGKAGEACSRCGHTIEKTKIAQRGTHYCPSCQVH